MVNAFRVQPGNGLRKEERLEFSSVSLITSRGKQKDSTTHVQHLPHEIQHLPYNHKLDGLRMLQQTTAIDLEGCSEIVVEGNQFQGNHIAILDSVGAIPSTEPEVAAQTVHKVE